MYKRRHITYIISNVSKSLGLEWTLAELIKKYEVSVILLNPQKTPLEEFLIKNNIKVIRIYYNGKKNIVSACRQIFFYLIGNKPNIVHTHLFDASLIGLTIAKILGIKKRIYTRHHSTYHHQYFPSAVKYDLWCNKMATHIISISQATYKTLAEFESVDTYKIRKVPHGFDLSQFDIVSNKMISDVKHKWNIPDAGLKVGVIARHIEWKGIQYIIPAFKKLLSHYTNAILILANANGPYHNTIMHLLKGIPVSNYRIIPFEENVFALYKLFDMYIHTPIDPYCEAFGQTYIEALASGIPSIFSLSGIANEIIEHEKNALVVNFKNSDDIYNMMLRLQTAKGVTTKISLNGKQSIQRFTLKDMMNSLENLYNE